MLGVLKIIDAIHAAEDRGLDLVEISPNANPPVCRIIDYGKFKYQQQKREQENRKKQKVIHLKEIKLRPTTDTHDFEVKLRSIQKFISNGDKVKVSLRFRGREIAHQEIGMQMMEKLKEATDEIAKVELGPKMEGRQIVMILVPR